MSLTTPAPNPVRLIAFYLPQFHPVPENDQWWGKGFTEWTNVVRAKPLFPGHYQPHLPADLGFYDLRVPETRQAQADLARAYGIYGFCYYHYWFNGRRILHRPLDDVLASGDPDFPFCLCWANENWTKHWYGGSRHQVLLSHDYTRDDDIAHIEALLPALQDRRYIRIDGRPLLLVYATELLPDPAGTAMVWRRRAAEEGIDLYLARVERKTRIDPGAIGFDAAVEFPPDWPDMWDMGLYRFRRKRYRILTAAGLLPRAYGRHWVTGYASVIDRMLQKPEPGYTRFHGVMPSWDNTPRAARDAVIVHESTPEEYEAWLRTVVQRAQGRLTGDEQIVFINAWNEWAEGNHLEPDIRWRHGYLEATRRALSAATTRPFDAGVAAGR